ncbi:MAG: HD domain-containing protein [Actinobacteria bacterium]|uniref:Unannotated protein n=1 Tax=freshwater metagenome TaxID=449393 RepID=A0A6J5YF36_9ZZZZ|nr:HD domain-containing protein [Actinomycetota bacterium]MTA77633.1 HD domain-containing protein [Actinomycetota bacterium]
MAAASHLISRFFGSLRPGGPSATERQWVSEILLPAEYKIWSSLAGPDRRHSATVARVVDRSLGDLASPPVLAAALLHDCGKIVSGLRTPGRVVATLIDAVLGHDDERARRWTQRSRPLRRFGQYWLHPQLGAELLDRAGSAPLTVAWTREHHLPAAMCTVETRFADALRDADDD